MIWFFATLVVLALGAVGVVAAGRGAPMSRVYDDRPDVVVPAEGPLTGDDVRSVRFSLAFRGYRMSEVDALLARLSDQLPEDAESAQTCTEHAPSRLEDAPKSRRVGSKVHAEPAESAQTCTEDAPSRLESAPKSRRVGANVHEEDAESDPESPAPGKRRWWRRTASKP